ncbi:MAG TPA: DNA-formamidopyrimidine glycosylase family protein [Nocardioidaceae bacterium]|nr:DNA-formamidopyrimidine glycosylase family protein [Nocardioidaceae bacterium]
MPEGDTVWRTALHLDRALSGQVLTASDFRVPAYATLDLSGQPVVQTLARGKHLLTRIGDGDTALTLHTHLKMEGSWHLYREGTSWRRPTHQARIVLRTAEWTAVGFSLGLVEVLQRDEENTVVGHLGPDLLGPDWDLAEAVRRINDDPDRPVGEAILDQRNLAGIGNMYKSELCFLLGLNPFQGVRDVPDVTALVRQAKRVLEANKMRTTQSTTGDTRRGKQLWVYRRDKEPCRRCGTPIKVDMQGRGTRERATYWCPHCQPAKDEAQDASRLP